MSEKNKQQNNAVQETISQYHYILDMIQAGINLIDKNGKIIFVNDAYCRMHDYTKEELIGKSLDVILPHQNRIEGLERYKKIINKEIKQPFVVEGFNTRHDGTSFPVLISWNYLYNHGELDGMVTVVQDLSQIREVEDALKESEQKYRSLVENISDFIWETDEQGNYTYVSPKSQDIFALSPEEMIAKKIWDFIIKKDFVNIEHLKQIIKDKEAFNHIELFKQKKDDKIVVIETSGVPIYNHQNVFCGFRGVDRDITAQKKVEEIDREIKELKIRLEKKEYLEYLMGDSTQIREIHNAVQKIARTNFSVIIYGETGTGKEIIANAIHNFSDREGKPLISVDCGAIPESLIESELFGAVKGSFTGATETKDGAFQMANGGTIFLDEITNLSLDMQKKLLRVLQEKEVKKVGSSKIEKLDIRVIAASNENIMKLVDDNKFRMDLYFRLNEFSIHIPPLRERKEDIPILTQRFLHEISYQLHSRIKTITREAMDLLYDYEWPGNVRELKNVVKKAVVISNQEIKPEHLELIKNSKMYINQPVHQVKEFNLDHIEFFDLKKIIGEEAAKIEKRLLRQGLDKFKGNKSKTARFFNIDYKTILKKIEEYGL